MKRIFCLLAVFCGVLSVFSGEITKKALHAQSSKPPKIAQSDILLKMPYQFYYFKDVVTSDDMKGRQLHCYFPNTEVDVTLDYILPDFQAYIEAAWYSPESDNAFFAINEGGNEIREITVYRISNKNDITDIMTLDGYLPSQYNNFDSSSNCSVEVLSDKIHIKGFKDNNKIDKIYSLELTNLPVLPPGEIVIEPKPIRFVKINSEGVNIRQRPELNAPRLGYFRCEECEYLDMENYAEWENNQNGVKPFKPMHPQKGEYYSYPADAESPQGWQPVDIGYNIAYMSSKFVDNAPIRHLSAGYGLKNEELKHYISMVGNGKYKGLWTYMMWEMDGSFLYLGKCIDGIVYFYGSCPLPYFNPGSTGLIKDGDNFTFGPNLSKRDRYNNEIFDVEQLSEGELSLLMQSAEYLERGFMPILVGFPDTEVLMWPSYQLFSIK